MLTGRIGLSPIMVGRSAALDRLRTVIDMAELHSSDLPTVALVAGEAGIGKTRLLREMLATLPSDVTVFSALAEPRSLGRAFDVVGQLAPADSADPAAAAIEAITQAAQRGRVALVIEDLHWIDADSVAVLDTVARQPWPNLVIVATYRPSDLSRGAPGGDFVLRLERRNEVEQFRLDRLDRNEVGALMAAIDGGAVSSAAVEAVYRRSGGVPFVIEELLRCCGPDACSDDIVGAQLPWSLEEAVRQQLSDLDRTERTIIEALAVFGQPAAFELLTTVTGFTERELLDGLRTLVERGIVEEVRSDRLWFGHALVAESVTNQLLGRERRRLHEACFVAISALDAEDHAALAHHAAGAGRFDEIVAIARVGSIAYLDRGATFQALRLACEGLAEDAEDPELLAVATEAAWRLDFLPEALGHARNLRQFATSTADTIDAMRFIARLHIELAEHAAATSMLDELIHLAEALPAGTKAEGSVKARAEAAVAQLLMLRNGEHAAEWAERAIAQAERSGDRAILVQARIEWASSQKPHAGRWLSLAALRDAIQGAREIGDGVLLSRAVNNTLELVAPLSAESKAMREELGRTAAAFGLDKLGRQNVLWWDAIAAAVDGDLAVHRRKLDEWASWTQAPMEAFRYRTQLASLASEEGRVADGLALLERDDDEEGRHGIDVALLRFGLHAIGRHPDVRDSFEQLLAAEAHPDNWFLRGSMVDAVHSALEAGISPIDIREQLFERYLANHPARVEVLVTAEGLLALAEGRHHDAVVALGPVLSEARETLPRSIEGSLQVAMAQALLGDGQRAAALQAARAAVETLGRWPGWRRDRAEAMLSRLEGSAIRPVGELTNREHEVALLIAEGLTNGQLAERLFISPKTAAVHVSNILAKLGLSSRTEIAAWSIRRELPVAG